MKTKFILLPFLFLAVGGTLHAQDWQHIYGHNFGMSWGYDVQQTADSGFIMIGDIDYPTGAIRHYIRLVKTDKNGDTIWTNIHHDFHVMFAQGRAVLPLDNGEYYISGTSTFNPSFQQRIHLAKLDAQGDTIWTKDYGFNTANGEGRVRFTLDNHLIIGGHTNSNFQPTPVINQAIILVKTDLNGDTSWTRQYPYLGSFQELGEIVATQDSGYLVVGSTNSASLIFKTDANGDTLWTLHNSNSTSDEVNTVIELPNSDFVVGGSFSGFAGYSPTLVRYDKNGNQIWMSFPWNFGKVYDVMLTTDNYLIATGYSPDSSGIEGFPHIAKLDLQGNIVWQKVINDTLNYAFGEAVIEAFDGDYVIGGTANGGFYLVRLDTSGTVVTTSTFPIKSTPQVAVRVFPNPATAMINFKIAISDYLPLTLKIFDTHGKVVQEKIINQSSTSVDIQHYAKGIYFYGFYNKNELVNSGKFLKR